MEEVTCVSIRPEKATTDLEIIEQWGKTNGGTAGDIRRQCPQLKVKILREISEMCEKLVAEGRLMATGAPDNQPDKRYVGRSLKKSVQYM